LAADGWPLAAQKERKERKKIMGLPVVHFEIGCRNKEVTEAFYGQMFDWNIAQSHGAAMIHTGNDIGIHGHITALGHEPHNYVTFYVQVDDLKGYLDKAETLGGKTLVPPVEIPGTGAFAWFADPDGNTIGLWKPLL
jgi:uncharacterized protein